MSINPAEQTRRNLAFARGELKEYGSGTLPDGTEVQFPNAMPIVGDLIQVVPADGEPMPAPAGPHEITVGEEVVSVVVDEAGIITEVMEAAESQAENADKPESEMAKELSELRKKQAEIAAQLAAMKGTPANTNPTNRGAKPTPEMQHFAAVAEGFKGYLMANNGDPEVQKKYGAMRIAPSGRRYAANPDNKVLTRSLTWFRDLFYQEIPANSILELMTRRSVPEWEGSSATSISTDIPRTRNVSTAGLQLDNGCGYDPQGNMELSTRALKSIALKKDWDPICPKNVRHFFEGTYYQGERRIPGEAAFLAQHTQQFMREIEKGLLLGDAGVGMTGLIPGILADSEYVAANQSTSISTPSATNTVAGVRSLIALIIAQIGKQGIDRRSEWIIGLSDSVYEFYLQDYIDQYGAVNWNNGYLKSAPDTSLNMRFVPIYDLDNRIFAMRRENALYVLEQRQALDIRDNPVSREILVSDYYAAGSSHVFANEYFQVTW